MNLFLKFLGFLLYLKMKRMTRILSRKLNWAQDDLEELDKPPTSMPGNNNTLEIPLTS